MNAKRLSGADVRVDTTALAESDAELADVLRALRRVTRALSSSLATLAAEPSRYATGRAQLDALEGERQLLVARLGALASRVLVLDHDSRESLVAAPASAPPAGAGSRPSDITYDAVDEDERHVEVPETWPHLTRTRGKDVVMIGGHVREERRIALESAFRCASLTWIPHNRPLLLRSLAESAASGVVDLLLVNKLVGRNETVALEKASSVPVVRVRDGYGVAAVMTALEEHFR